MSSSTAPTTHGPRLLPWIPGLLVMALGVALAMVLSTVQTLLGALVLALILGIVLGNSGLYTAALRPGISGGTKRLLRAGVVLLGLQLALPDILALGAQVILLIVASVAVSFTATLWIGRRFGLSRAGALLMAAGFSICGASAIAGMQGIVDADDDEVASAVAMVTLYGSLMILALPLLNLLVGLGAEDFGIWSGLAVHEVAQVVAVASTAGTTALAAATVVKLGRVLMLAPVAAVASIGERRHAARSLRDAPPHAAQHGAQDVRRTTPLVPLFVLGFLAAVILRSSGVLPEVVLDVGRTLTTILLAAGMFGLGAGIDIRRLLHTGGRFAAVGAASTALLAGISLLGVLALA
ncbi:putative sulfate exporter family transporter [Arthrobacter echini]|uniref:Putative sulfate exporter family transporter n=1 Tax=Arthrobacter echini TaxID=1529066 RepID=A0A5D0XSS5_9MICC|nr:putative sulfate exporter family transporter [Arthrobacter echini]TYC99550.1 putative sulfate exporter family transporter [Arthrobacter echini]